MCCSCPEDDVLIAQLCTIFQIYFDSKLGGHSHFFNALNPPGRLLICTKLVVFVQLSIQIAFKSKSHENNEWLPLSTFVKNMSSLESKATDLVTVNIDAKIMYFMLLSDKMWIKLDGALEGTALRCNHHSGHIWFGTLFSGKSFCTYLQLYMFLLPM